MSSSTYQVSRSHKRPISLTEDAPPTKKTKTSTVPHATPEVVPRQSKKRSFTQMQVASREFEETDEMIVKKSEVKESMDEFDEWIQDIEDYDGFECPDDDEDVEEVLENMQSVSLF